jgi:hypothetical protein
VRKEAFSVILVYSTSYAIRAEKLLAQEGIPVKLIPVPRQLSSDCGVCVRVKRNAVEAALRILERAGLEIDGAHDL